MKNKKKNKKKNHNYRVAVKTPVRPAVHPAVQVGLNIALCVLIFVGFLCFFSAWWYVRVYGRIGFDSVLYTITSNLGGVQSSLVISYLATGALPAVICTAAVFAALFFLRKNGKPLLKRWVAVTVSIVLSLGLIVHAAFNVELVDYIVASGQSSSLFATEYRDPGSTKIAFPQQKRNLIYIMLESMETTYLSEAEGGALDENMIPELSQLANENLNFSQSSGIGGFQEVPGSGWTIGAMVAHTAGVPLKTPSNLSDRFNGYGKDGIFLPGLTSLSDILHENGYNQALMVGSDVRFGGRDAYYKSHGVDNIYDLYTAREDGIIPSDYFVWWGMEDVHLFRYATEKLTEMAAAEEPFAFTMLTVDTHHVGGYKCALCENDHAENYENVMSCSSQQVYEFVRWIQEQDFYENTTVIITGDHRTMDNGYISRNVGEDYTRRVYNCFINSAAEPAQAKNREFTTVDMFPTTLAAMGCTIEGNRLGLGTNLFSNAPTLAEVMGYDPFIAEVGKDSAYYATHFFVEN